MSSYVVDDTTINSIISAMKYAMKYKRIYPNPEYDNELRKPAKELGQAMFELNCEAVNQRYGENQAQEFRSLDYEWKEDFHNSQKKVYDNLGEFIYQCSEGDVPNMPLFKAIDNYYAALAHKIARTALER